MNKKILHLCAVLYVSISLNSFAQEQSEPDENLQIETSIQAGMEYDSNVFKTFNNANGDFLTRLLFKNKGNYWVQPSLSIGWDYQGGGKKFLNDMEQDQIIQTISAPLHWIPSSKFQIFFEPDLKYQNERDRLDANLDDINEDFLSTKSVLRAFIARPNGFNLQPSGSFTYFHFYPNQTFSFAREEGGLTLEKRFKNVATGLTYTIFQQQFKQSFREDTIQEISPYVQFLRKPFAALSYAYQVNKSNDPAFSFDNHKINFLTSFLFGKIQEREGHQPQARFSFHLIATLQLKNYSSVFSETPEGERFLVTGSEDENFNNLIAKLNYHFHRNWALETKYTRISNDLTNQVTKFARSIYYAGLRYDF
ncbi:MAG: hypothetical protein IT286_03930 [Proteobacteria bacterium]|nr:hypothetical protein [Pseudomonadota bacterium]